MTFIIPEDAPVPVSTINLPSQDVVKANIFISLFGALKATKFAIMAFIGGTSGSDTLLADINNFYDSSQQIRNAAIAIENRVISGGCFLIRRRLPGGETEPGRFVLSNTKAIICI